MKVFKMRRCLLACLLLFNGLAAFSKENLNIVLENSLNKVRIDEPICLSRDDIEKKSGKISDAVFVALIDEKGTFVPCQMDDLNDDGKWDELAFILDFKKNEKRSIKLTITDKEIKYASKRVNIHLGVSRNRNNVFVDTEEEERPQDHVAQSTPFLYQYEGPGWENDKVAFRSYFDSRNGKDVFGKLTTSMVLDSIGLPGKSYHEFAPWGMDVLKVGKTLGAGALAVTDGDSLFRLGATAKAHFKVISEGPVRAILKLTYDGWKVKGQNLKLVEQITIWAGKYYFTSKVKLSGAQNLFLVSGLPTLHLIDSTYQPEFIRTPDNYVGLAINNILSENKDFLGLGMLTSNSDFKTWKKAPDKGAFDDIINTAYLVLNSDKKEVEFRLFAGWEKSDLRFKTEKLINQLMFQEAEKLNRPILIKFIK